MTHDKDILRELQKAQPWLVRVCVDDANFAKVLGKINIAIIKDNNQFRAKKMDELLVMIMKGLAINLPDNESSLAPLAGYIFIWLRYVCLNNRILYRNVLSVCFDNDTILDDEFERREYTEGRLLGLGIPDSQLDDIYFMLKGYIDTIFKIGPLAKKIAIDQFGNKEHFLKMMNQKHEETEVLSEYLDANEIAEIVMRDFFDDKKVYET